MEDLLALGKCQVCASWYELSEVDGNIYNRDRRDKARALFNQVCARSLGQGCQGKNSFEEQHFGLKVVAAHGKIKGEKVEYSKKISIHPASVVYLKVRDAYVARPHKFSWGFWHFKPGN